MITPLVRAHRVSRRYGDILALHEVSLDVHAGELVGLLGPNGAGKSTLINMFTGLRRPRSGTVELGGGNPRERATRQIMGVTPQQTALPEQWRVGELVDFVAAHYPSPLDRGEVLARFDLRDLRDRQVGGLSGGQQRRLAVALAFTGRPRVVFLDEPTTGLDVEARHSLWQGIRAYHADGGTVLITSHYLQEIEALARRVVVLNRGRVIADAPLADVRGLVGLKRVSLTCAALPALPGVAGLERDGDRTHLLTADADKLVRDLTASGAPFHDLQVSTASLEDAFLALTARAAS
ncbi:ABC transporter ATP-binding protein [Sphaerisporangium sp. TRM90804]|uniref:ABC transporter ATP-binding protein n=1 Tax=Sphaerisporangium sp. TRM90804 TaxID=3031113 RepID=UPI00244D53AD|nr:ABC transporter ATP-binding protein [Sphaerisporangium sp. TRM90804]MDH2430606.1 ABC transporter ATP-binding protein [Sphaerisporangium sp. TRM90804]